MYLSLLVPIPTLFQATGPQVAGNCLFNNCSIGWGPRSNLNTSWRNHFFAENGGQMWSVQRSGRDTVLGQEGGFSTRIAAV